MGKVEEHIADALARAASWWPAASARPRRQLLRADHLTGVTPEMKVAKERPSARWPAVQLDTEAEVIAWPMTPNSAWRPASTAATSAVCRVAERLNTAWSASTPGLSPTKPRRLAASNNGLGREGSHYGMDDYLEIKYLLVGGLDRQAPLTNRVACTVCSCAWRGTLR